MKYIDRLIKSRTVRHALYVKIGGILTILAANLGYFEDSLSAEIIGGIMIVNGIYQYLLRVDTENSIK